MDHMKLSDELRQQLMESAAWGKAGIILGEGTIEEKKMRHQQGVPKGTSKSKRADIEATGDIGERHAKEAGKKHDAGQRDRARLELSHTTHVCPLCVSELSEAIDEERVLEHLNVVVGLVDRLSQLNEGDEDIETVIDETIAELLFQDLDEDSDEE
jgi:DNA repair exonuclease SbcCD ATPase subunit